jgi:DNA-binding transcriptional LysR family regulator
MHRTFAHFIEGARLRAFLESHPELELITRDQLGDLVSEGFDVAIHVGNPPVLAGVLLTMLLLGLLATFIPARRTLAIDPAQLLRE